MSASAVAAAAPIHSDCYGRAFGARAVAELRAYVRQRERMLDCAASHIQYMQNTLTEMNLQRHHVVADIPGATGLSIIPAILAGERDPEALACLRHYSCVEGTHCP